MTIATADLVRANGVDVVTQRIGARAPVRKAFAGHSSGAVYYETKGSAYHAFDSALRDYGLRFDDTDFTQMPDNDGWATFGIVCNGSNVRVGYARLSWHRMESGRYEVIGYIS